jgi:hypothetical protein
MAVLRILVPSALVLPTTVPEAGNGVQFRRERPARGKLTLAAGFGNAHPMHRDVRRAG